MKTKEQNLLRPYRWGPSLLFCVKEDNKDRFVNVEVEVLQKSWGCFGRRIELEAFVERVNGRSTCTRVYLVGEGG